MAEMLSENFSVDEFEYSETAIAKKMSERYGIDINESTVRSLLDEERERRMMQAKNTASNRVAASTSTGYANATRLSSLPSPSA